MKTILMSSLLACAGALTLSACAPTQSTETPGGETAYKACKVEDYQAYVGRNRSEIPAAPQGQIFRVLCTTCPATMDYRENRVNFVYEEPSGVVRQVKCG